MNRSHLSHSHIKRRCFSILSYRSHTYGHWPRPTKVRAISSIALAYRLFFFFCQKQIHQNNIPCCFGHICSNDSTQCVQRTLTLNVRFVRPKQKLFIYLWQILNVYINSSGLANRANCDGYCELAPIACIKNCLIRGWWLVVWTEIHKMCVVKYIYGKDGNFSLTDDLIFLLDLVLE